MCVVQGTLFIWVGMCCAGQVLVRGVLFVCYAVFRHPEVDWLLFGWLVLFRGWMLFRVGVNRRVVFEYYAGCGIQNQSCMVGV